VRGTVRVASTHRPANDVFPARAWRAGEIWLDKIALAIPREIVLGEARLMLRVVDESSGRVVSEPIELARLKIAARE
jgi:hypothetical protein